MLIFQFLIVNNDIMKVSQSRVPDKETNLERFFPLLNSSTVVRIINQNLKLDSMLTIKQSLAFSWSLPKYESDCPGY